MPAPAFGGLPSVRRDQPDLEIILSDCAMGREPESADQLRALVARGAMGLGVLETDDCRRTFEELSAKRGDVPGLVTLIARRGEVHLEAIGRPRDRHPRRLRRARRSRCS